MKGTKVLFVDDEEDILRPVAHYFSGLGCEVDVATEAEEAQAIIAHRRYDLFFLDVCLNQFASSQGLMVLREIRCRNRFASIVMLSGVLNVEIEEEALRSGADAVLRKPQRLGDLAWLAFRILGVPDSQIQLALGGWATGTPAA